MHLSMTTGNLISGKEKETAQAKRFGCLMSPETGLLPGHLTQQRVAVGNRASAGRFLVDCVLRLSFFLQLAALRVSIMENNIET